MKLHELKPKSVFLIDGVGALLSAQLLLAVLAPFETIFGMPKEIIYLLSIPAFLFASYSLGCYFFFPKNWKTFFKIIAISNSAYCFTTLVLLILHLESLTVLGTLYFLGEIIVIAFIVRIEYAVIKNHKSDINT